MPAPTRCDDCNRDFKRSDRLKRHLTSQKHKKKASAGNNYNTIAEATLMILVILLSRTIILKPQSEP
jgi:hypothetical protein